MAHIVNRRGYLSLEESYRDDGGRPRKRVLRYFGKRSIDVAATLKSTDHGVDWAAIERGEIERQDKTEAAYQAKLAALPQGLAVGPTDPVPVDTQQEQASEAIADSPNGADLK